MNDLISRSEAINEFWKSEIEFRPSQIDEVLRILNAIPTTKPKEYVKDGTLTVQMPTIKEAKAIDKIVVYADTYKQEYYMPLPKVGRWIIRESASEKTPRRWKVECSACHKRLRITDRKLWNFCPNCGAKMEENR